MSCYCGLEIGHGEHCDRCGGTVTGNYYKGGNQE